MNKQMLIDFINYGIIASVFLVIPYTTTRFLAIIIPLIYDFIMLYIIEQKQIKKNQSDLKKELFSWLILLFKE